jgi:proline iminopeptidase
MYPEIEPYDQGLLDVGDGNRVYWEVCGNPYGKPVVFLHGGPGGGCKPVHRRLFDPAVYRIVLLDQRGCGRSIPHAAEPDSDLSANTTWHLVADLEKVREHLGVDRWQVSGGSWGSTLALAYAEMYPERVTELVLRGVFTLRRKELDWFYRGGAGMLFPEMWERLTALVPEGEDVIEAYGRLLNDPDPVVRETAAVTWSVWEASTVALVERPELVADFGQPRFALAFARIENHYFRHAGWLEEGQLLRDAGKLAGIPGVIVQGRYDMATPATSAWELHRAWPGSELVMVPDAGHAFDEPGVLRALLAATDRFRA